MNEFSINKIKELNAVPLQESKEWGKINMLNKLKGRQVYWEWKQQVYTIKHICPMTYRVWFTEYFNGWLDNTNATNEMYLIPKNETKISS